ncbi:MarR family winged helix-turn-helix transcriptional regulator [Paenibacillus planticolens]|nr:MarR family transcriptional regulator [Paenibacillus planticolens]
MDLLDNIAVLIHDVKLEVAMYMAKSLAPYDITPEQAFIIILLNERDGLSQGEIASALRKDKSSITRMLVSLENKGLMHKITSSYDRRYYKVSLTDKGKSLAANVIPCISGTIDVLQTGFSLEEMNELHRLLMKMRDNMKK